MPVVGSTGWDDNVNQNFDILDGSFPWFDVKWYGAKGDTKYVRDATTTSGSAVISSPTVAFEAADVGKKVWVLRASDGALILAVSTIVQVNSATEAVAADNATASLSATGHLVVGTDDTAAILDARAAALAFLKYDGSTGGVPTLRGATLYFPPGGYILSQRQVLHSKTGIGFGGLTTSMNIIGSGARSTHFYLQPGVSLSRDGGEPPGAIVRIESNNMRCGGFALLGMGHPYSGSNNDIAWFTGSMNRYFDMRALDWNRLSTGNLRTFAFNSLGIGTIVEQISVDQSRQPITFEQGEGDFQVRNIQVAHTPAGAGLSQFRIKDITGSNKKPATFSNIFADENDSRNSILIENSQNIHFYGVQAFQSNESGQDHTTRAAFRVDGTSEVYVWGGQFTRFGTQSGDHTMIRVASGGKLSLAGVRAVGLGSGWAIDNAGTVFDVGANTFINGFNGNLPIPNLLLQRAGSGTPEGAVTAPVGAIYHRLDGGAGTTLYVKESGTGNTGWVAK